MPGKRARRHFSQLSEFERGLIIGMKTAGWSTRRVAGQVYRSECAVRNCCEQWTREGTHARKTGSGETRKTTRRDDRRIVRQALVDHTVTRSTIRADVGVAIVPQTISRHLAESNLKSKHPFRAFPLTPEHRQLRLQWCQARSMWNVTDWQKVVFSDESRFVLGTDDNRVRVWRRPGAVVPTRRRNMSHSSCHNRFIERHFGDRLISRFGPVNWLPRSCDLTPLDYFLCGYVKLLVYTDKPQTLDHLEDNIRRVIVDIRPQMLEKSSKIGRPDWTTSEPAVAVLCQKSYLKCAKANLCKTAYTVCWRLFFQKQQQGHEKAEDASSAYATMCLMQSSDSVPMFTFRGDRPGDDTSFLELIP
ncbi:transposable element Tc1 transposase [Trichonephila clavipes]|nr:transposable element Tc1 transposase [Trichonephila clavipes]